MGSVVLLPATLSFHSSSRLHIISPLIDVPLVLDDVLKFCAASVYFELTEALHDQITAANSFSKQIHMALLHVPRRVLGFYVYLSFVPAIIYTDHFGCSMTVQISV